MFISGYSAMNNIKHALLQDSDRELFIFSDGMFRFEKN